MEHQELYLEMIKSVTQDDYRIVNEYQNIELACIAANLILGVGGSISNPLLPYKVNFNKNIYFKSKKDGLIPFFMAQIQENGQVKLFEFTDETYSRLGF